MVCELAAFIVTPMCKYLPLAAKPPSFKTICGVCSLENGFNFKSMGMDRAPDNETRLESQNQSRVLVMS